MHLPLVFPVAIVVDGAVLARFDAPVQFEGPDDVAHPVSAWALWTADDWAAMCPGWTALSLIDTPPVVAGKRAVARPMADWTVGADAVTVAYEMVEQSPEEAAAELSAAQAERKSRVSGIKRTAETSGLTLGAMGIATDRESQGMVGGAYSAAKNGVADSFDFKGTDGWHTVTADLMIIVGEAVFRHIQACFSRERALHEAIDAAGTVDAVLAIDISAGWPGGTAADPAALGAYRALIQRRADALVAAGDDAAALMLLQKEKML